MFRRGAAAPRDASATLENWERIFHEIKTQAAALHSHSDHIVIKALTSLTLYGIITLSPSLLYAR
jgi:hypothetical protein